MCGSSINKLIYPTGLRCAHTKARRVFYFMNYTKFKVNRKFNVLEFQKDYWYPIEYFNVKVWDSDVSDGLYHLLGKSWFDEQTLKEVLHFLKSEYPDFDFAPTIKYHKKHLETIKKLLGNG